MADESQMEHNSEDYDIIDGTEHHNGFQNGSVGHKANGVAAKGKVDFGAQLKRTPQKMGRAVVRHPNDNPDYLAHLKKTEGTVAIRPAVPRGEGKTDGEHQNRMTADELMKIASTAMKEVDDKDKRDMAARRGMGAPKAAGSGTRFEGVKPNEDTERLDFKSVLRKSIRKGSSSSNSKKAEDKPEWTQQKRAIKVTDIENKMSKPKGGGECPEWADKVHKMTARQRVTELEHKKASSHQGSEAPEWAAKVPKDSRNILAKTEQRFKGRAGNEERPNYRGVLKSSNDSSDRRSSQGSSGRYSE